MSSSKMLVRNLMIYGVGGIITPFVGIKIIDLIISPSAGNDRLHRLLRRFFNMSTSKGSAAGSIRQAVVTTLVLLLICGFLFPVLMTGLGSLIFPSQAGGNLIYVDGQPVGSRFVGQEFTDPRFMRGRPSQYHYNTYYVGEGWRELLQ